MGMIGKPQVVHSQQFVNLSEGCVLYFHYIDDSELYRQGEYDTLEEAIAACKKVMETSVVYKPGATADEFYRK